MVTFPFQSTSKGPFKSLHCILGHMLDYPNFMRLECLPDTGNPSSILQLPYASQYCTLSIQSFHCHSTRLDATVLSPMALPPTNSHMTGHGNVSLFKPPLKVHSNHCIAFWVICSTTQTSCAWNVCLTQEILPACCNYPMPPSIALSPFNHSHVIVPGWMQRY